MSGPLRQAVDEPTAREDDRFDPNNLVPGTSLARLASWVRNTRPGEPSPEGPAPSFDFVLPDDTSGFQQKYNPNGVPNPYGQGLDAFEPNTVLWDQYAAAYNKVQESKAEDAQQQLVEFDFSQGAVGGSVSGVPFASVINSAASQYGVPAPLLAALLRAESNFSPTARSSAGAVGIAQFLPSTAAGMGVNPLDPNSAIPGAARYLKSNFDRFGSWDLALAAYNAGPGAVSKYGGVPPYAETQGYVRRVNAYYQEYSQGGQLSTLVSPGGGAPGANFSTGGVVDAAGKTRGMVSAALQLAARGVPYVWGGAGPSGVDCSGLIFYAARAAGIPWQRYRAIDYGRMGSAVSLSQARPGDIVYTDNPNTDTDHVGIYIGNGQMVQAPFSGQKVQVTGVGNFTSIRRIFDDGSYTPSVNNYGQAVPLYNGMTYNPAPQARFVQAVTSVPLFGSIVGRALVPNPREIERTQQTGRIKAI